MKVVHVSTHDVLGGAAKAAYRLHRGLLGIGCDSTMFVAHRSSEDPTVKAFIPPRDRMNRVRRRMRRLRLAAEMARYAKTRPAEANYFTDDRSQFGATVIGQLPTADVVNLHWVAEFLDYRSFFRSLLGGPQLVWTLHDENPFTGGCHYPGSCSRFAKGCGACPALGSSQKHDLSSRIWETKRGLFASPVLGEHLAIVCPSRWLAGQVARSPMLAHVAKHVIPNGVDVREFSPVPRSAARAALGLAVDEPIAMFAAHDLADYRKGGDILANALAALHLEGTRVTTLSVGSGSSPAVGPPDHHHFGFVNSPRLLAALYSAADIVVVPSREDISSNVTLEASACGTPVVAFRIGGIPELIDDGSTGVLLPAIDPAAIAEAMRALLGNPDRTRTLGANARAKAEREFDIGIQAERYEEVYAALSRTLSATRSDRGAAGARGTRERGASRPPD